MTYFGGLGRKILTPYPTTARPYFRIQHGRSGVRSCLVYLNVHSVTGNDLLSFGDGNTAGSIESC